jgi:hypothetical protein
LQQERPNDRKKLYEANHLCMMKLALVKAKSTRTTTTSRHHSSIVKRTYHKSRRKFQISPLDGAQYASISSKLKQATRENNARYNSKIKDTPHAYSQTERNSDQPSQNHYYSHFYLTQNKHTQFTQFARQKEQRMP